MRSIALLCVLVVAGPLHAQHAIRVRWPLVDILVRGDTSSALDFLVSPNASSAQGASANDPLESMWLDPLTALQWSQLMSRLLDSAAALEHRAATLIQPALETSDKEVSLALGVDPAAKGDRRLFIDKRSPLSGRNFRAYATKGEVRAMLSALRHVADWMIHPDSIVPPPRHPCPVPKYDPSWIEPDGAPVRLTGPRLVYPEAERRRGIQGRAWVQFTLDTNGTLLPGSDCVLLSDSPGFSRTARTVLAASLFRPARRIGVPERAVVVMEFLFLLHR
jgi:TonB family protein